MSNYRCPLGAIQIDKPDVEETKRDGWRAQKILVVSLDDAENGNAALEVQKIIKEK